jgi:hypothetical protein
MLVPSSSRGTAADPRIVAAVVSDITGQADACGSSGRIAYKAEHAISKANSPCRLSRLEQRELRVVVWSLSEY